ncbi:Magnesium transporter MRS2-B [Hondaea fermentalgiana]|uniref:Magnesium transporter n=1 Tax=Hondaea fermentalgiana TaxID=2315210 RepID=A0A2R5GK43_9STRA|nr:Magnesium transporter MRS2-B [Hondaea fermentalgiana]|eukprot:GBG31250.1 Magnesium transporter MRS2-B [Hondaea fermentalgiana]
MNPSRAQRRRDRHGGNGRVGSRGADDDNASASDEDSAAARAAMVPRDSEARRGGEALYCESVGSNAAGEISWRRDNSDEVGDSDSGSNDHDIEEEDEDDSALADEENRDRIDVQIDHYPGDEPDGILLNTEACEREHEDEPRYSDISDARLSPKVMMARNRLSSLGLDLEEPLFHTKSTKKRFVHKQQPMLVLEFRDNGQMDFVELRRDDIMQEARRMVPEPRLLPMNTLEELEITAAALEDPAAVRRRFKGTLQHRDIRVLDPSFAQSRDPGILARRHSILVNLQPIRALLFYNKTLVFVPDGADSILSTLMQRLRDAGEESASVSFSMRSLESIFVTVCQLLHDEVTKLTPEVHTTVEEIIKTSSGVTIERLRQAKSRVSKISSRLLGVQAAFEELLENDRDMALMNLDKVHNFPDYYNDDREEIWCVDHEDIELLVENYAQAIDGTFSQVEALRSEIDSAIGTITLRLDSARNKLLGIDLLVTSVTSAAAIGALIAALFGMNLNSGVAEDPHWFWGWFGGVMVAVPLIVAFMFYGIYRAGLLIT